MDQISLEAQRAQYQQAMHMQASNGRDYRRTAGMVYVKRNYKRRLLARVINAVLAMIAVVFVVLYWL